MSEFGAVRLKELLHRINRGMSDIAGDDIPLYESAARLGFTTPLLKAGDTGYVYAGVGISDAGMKFLTEIPDPLLSVSTNDR